MVTTRTGLLRARGTLTIVDIGNKTSRSLISRTGYSQSNYTHQVRIGRTAGCREP